MQRPSSVWVYLHVIYHAKTTLGTGVFTFCSYIYTAIIMRRPPSAWAYLHGIYHAKTILGMGVFTCHLSCKDHPRYGCIYMSFIMRRPPSVWLYLHFVVTFTLQLLCEDHPRYGCIYMSFIMRRPPPVWLYLHCIHPYVHHTQNNLQRATEECEECKKGRTYHTNLKRMTEIETVNHLGRCIIIWQRLLRTLY